MTLLLVCSRNVSQGTSQVVQWLGLCTSTAGSLGSIPGWGRYCKSSGQKKKKCELDPQVVVIQSLSHVKRLKTTWTAASKLGLISTAEGKAPHLWEEKASPPGFIAFPLLLPTPLPAWEWLGRLGREVEVYCPAKRYVYPIKGETGCAYAYLNTEN